MKSKLKYFVKYRFPKVLFVLHVLIQSSGCLAQVLELQNLPASTNWQQIDTDNFRVIFPEGFESEANRTMNILEAIKEPASKSLYNKTKKFSIVLQNKQGFSNGFVSIGPRRSEFFTIHPQDYNFAGNNDWVEFLAVHEYRHMVQFSKAYSTGFLKLNYWLFGEYGIGAWSGLAAPRWFWEGDAVGIETAATPTGRGRIPNFSIAYKTNLLEKGSFNYSKQSLRSFKDFIPNHYRLGYFMTTHLKRKYGVDIWDKIIHRSFSLPFIPFSFSNAIKKVTGKNVRQTYEELSTELTELYSNQLSGIVEEDHKIINRRKNNIYTNYFYPTRVSSNQTIALKSGFSDISTFISIDGEGREREVFIPGIFNDPGQLCIQSGKIVWVELEFDPRWRKQSYSVVKSFDIETGTLKTLTQKSRYTNAVISPDGKVIAAIQNSENDEHGIHLIDPMNGSLIKAFENPNNHFYSMPSFSKDGNELVLLKNANRVKSIILKHIGTGGETVITESETENFGHPILYNDWILYNSAVNGIDNIYAINKVSKQAFQITNAKYGAYNPSVSPDENNIFYNVFSKNGMDVAKMEFEPSKWIAIDEAENRNFNYESPMVEEEGISEVLSTRSDSTYAIKKYSQLKSLVRPFSWGILSNETDGVYKFGIASQDVLSTTSIEAGLLYLESERTALKFATVSYQGFYPILDFTVFDGKRSTNEIINNQIQSFDWNETTLLAGLRLPLTLTNSKYLRKINMRARVRTTKITDFNNPQPSQFEQQNGSLRALEYQFQFIRLLKRSKLDINSRFGQTLAINYKHTPIGGQYFSNQFAAQSNLYFPGFIKHHSIRIRGSFQYEDRHNYRFSSPIIFTRGFGYTSFETYSNVALNYAFPLFYPDIHIGPLFNLQRIYSNVFYDYGRGIQDDNSDFDFKSYGAEVSMNFNFMRFAGLLNVGIRYAYLPDFNDNVIQILIGGVSF